MYHDRKALYPANTRWTAEDDAMLRELAARGMSAGHMVGYFSGRRTRNAIIGRIHRLKIALGRPAPTAADRERRLAQKREEMARARLIREDRARAARIAAGKASRANVAPKPAAAPVARPVALPEPAPAPVRVHAREGKPLMALKAGECRWGVTPHFARSHRFCAEPVMGEGRPYCREHWLLSLNRDVRDKAIIAEARAAHRRRTAGQVF